MTKHTPGPWHVVPFISPATDYRGAVTSFHICRPHGLPNDYPAVHDALKPDYHRIASHCQTEADARLIAEAPAMLKCIVMFLEACCDRAESFSEAECNAFDAAAAIRDRIRSGGQP